MELLSSESWLRIVAHTYDHKLDVEAVVSFSWKKLNLPKLLGKATLSSNSETEGTRTDTRGSFLSH